MNYDPIIIISITSISIIIIFIILFNSINIIKNVRFRRKYPKINNYMMDYNKYKYICDNLNIISSRLSETKNILLCGIDNEECDTINFIIRKPEDLNTGIDIQLQSDTTDVKIILFKDNKKEFNFLITNKIEDNRYEILNNKLSEEDINLRMKFIYECMDIIMDNNL